ncbi:MAG: quinolinate synthase [Bacteroidetes bacterium GWF2_42_66]|nr:MAG: quinolinate synthase [Bacteroidetes bacterium GWA2_42_15]OFX98535.1 MAG: quinolinate synthase [Bacteroidetes bacterium GWE2_42_39]OFY42917.1 MAG: quinolinate synthase [Bacteroidetes bacterium GWF2_42_66]HBL74439.1 quinolinate synthase [Prolixibacteraceae bacterium]HCR90938.1 quinolinate synthase [Prolixibacteraceae bacterium]
MEELSIRQMLEEKGFIDEKVSPDIKLVEEIKRLKKEKNAVILSHYYVDSELQDIADYVGDSLGLAQEAAKTTADLIVFVGVHFMAETAKIINPTKKVILPDLKAGCSLAESAPIEKFAAFKAQYPDHKVISYVNCTADLKTMTDVVCTSANAEKIVNSFPKDEKLIFAPDKNLGNYINSITGRNMVLWDGACMVHEKYSVEKIIDLMDAHPDAEFIAHPECEKPVLLLAKHIGSTTSLLNHVKQSSYKKFIVATESGILHQMKKACPEKIFIPAPANDSTCACNDCSYMKLNSLQKLYICMKHELPEVTLSEEVIEKAKIPILRMLEISK